MKKNLLTSLMSVVMIFMVSVMTSFADDTAKASMTSADFLATSNEAGIITLSENTTLTDSLKVDSGKYIVDLNGHTLKFTKANNLFVNNANVTFKNGTINFDNIVANADCILGIGHYGNRSKLTLDTVKLEANNYNSAFALIYLYSDSELNIINSTLSAKNEKSTAGGVIKTASGTDGKINITDSTLNFENTVRGFLDGSINIKNSKVEMKGLINAINSSNGKLNLIIDNSNLTITNNIGYGLTIDKSNVDIKNKSVVNISAVLADIRFSSEGKFKVDESSKLNFKDFNIAKGIKLGLNELIELGLYKYKLNEDTGKLILDDNGNPIRVCEHNFEEGRCNICDESVEIGSFVGDIEGIELDDIHINVEEDGTQSSTIMVSLNTEDTKGAILAIDNLSEKLNDKFNFEIVDKVDNSEESNENYVKYIVYKIKLNPKSKNTYTSYIEIKVPADNEEIISKIEDVFTTKEEDIIPPQEEVIFNDIKGHWAQKTIEEFVKKGYINGYGDNTFKPQNSMTRAEFIRVVNNVFGYTQKGEEEFKDVNKDDWFYEDICIAVKEGYIKGKSKDIFAPNDYITRQEVAMILTNIMNNKDENLDKLNTFKDGNKTDKWAQSSVEGAIEAGYLSGDNEGLLNPTNNITRAEAISMLSRVKK